MPNDVVFILLIDPTGEQERTIRDMLACVPDCALQLERVATYEAALATLSTQPPDIALIAPWPDQAVPTATDLVHAALAAGCLAPLIVLTATSDPEAGRTVLAAGATDYLPLLELTPALLTRAIRYARAYARKQEALQQSQERLQAILDHSPLPIWGKDASGRYEVWCRQSEREFQLPASAVLGKTDADLFPPAVAEMHQATDLQVLRDNCAITFEGAPMPDSNGTLRRYQVTKFPLRHPDGRPYAVYGIAADITARMRAEAERLAMERAMQEAQRLESLGVLAGGIAHDFNNLLQAILGNSELLARAHFLEASARESAAQIIAAARRAAELTQQLLAYAGKGQVVVAPLDLNEVVHDTATLLSASVGTRVTLRYQLAPELPAVMADRAQLRQVVMNLVLNGAEAIAEAGTVTLTTGVRDVAAAELASYRHGAELPPGRYVFLEVTDTGSGMDAATLARIFDPFFTTKFTGRGLGLAAVLGIIRGHQGTLKVTSVPGRGATFTILLPALAAPTAPSSTTSAGTATWHGSGTVLVVDDEDSVRMVAARMLERLGFAVLMAADGWAALEIVRTSASAIRCVLLDLTMPRMSGAELLAAIRRIRPDLPIVLMSGYAVTDMIGQLEGDQVAAYLQKPFTPRDMYTTMQQILDC
jgi:PAS domain S-box-containing protein